MESLTTPHNGTSPSSSSSSVPSKSSVKITHVKDRSNSSAVIQKLVRPLKSRLIKIKEQPGGSLQLNAPDFCHEHCTVHERIVKGIHIYDMNVRSGSTDRFVHILDSAKTFRRESKAETSSKLKPRLSQPNLKSSSNGRSSAKSPTGLPPASNPSPPYTGSKDFARKPSPLSTSMTNGTSASNMTPTLDYNLFSPMTRHATAPNLDTNHFSPLTQSSTHPLIHNGQKQINRIQTKDWALHHDGVQRKRPRHIYYFAGGSWQMPPSKEHWKFCIELTRQLTSRGTPTTVSLVSHPLAPKTSAHGAFPMLEHLYYELFPTTATIDADEAHLAIHDPEIILAGDSSGGNIALALTMHILSADVNAPAPASLMLLSPAVDMRTDNPALVSLEKKDPLLSIKSIQQAHDAWRGEAVTERDPRVSPILGDLFRLRERGVHVNGVNSGFDLLSSDVRRFLVRMEEEGVSGRWLEWEKQMHVFPMTFSYGLEDGKKGVEWIVNCIDSPQSRVEGLET